MTIGPNVLSKEDYRITIHFSPGSRKVIRKQIITNKAKKQKKTMVLVRCKRSVDNKFSNPLSKKDIDRDIGTKQKNPAT